MKTYLKYGVGVAVIGFVSMVVCYVLGLWDPEHMGTGIIVGILMGVTIHIFGIVLGTRVERAPSGPKGFSYGAAFKVGFMISLVAAAVGIGTNLIFFTVVNPNHHENTIVWTKSFMERMGAPAAQIEKAEEQMRAKASNTRDVLNGVIGALVFGVIISLITAAVMKRAPSEDVADAPPLVT